MKNTFCTLNIGSDFITCTNWSHNFTCVFIVFPLIVKNEWGIDAHEIEFIPIPNLNDKLHWNIRNAHTVLQRSSQRNTCRHLRLPHFIGFCTLSSLYLVTHVHKTDSQAHTDAYTHTHRFRTMLFSKTHISKVILGNSLLAKTLSSRPLTVPSVKMWCELKVHGSFCSLGEVLLGCARRRWREDLFLPVHYLQCPLPKVKLGDCLSFNKQLKANPQEVFFCCNFNPQLSHIMLQTWGGREGGGTQTPEIAIRIPSLVFFTYSSTWHAVLLYKKAHICELSQRIICLPSPLKCICTLSP